MLHKDLEKNEFLRTVNVLSERLLRREIKKKGFRDRVLGLKKPTPWNKKPPQTRFFLTMFWGVNEITHKIESLEHCIVFLNSFPKTKLWSKHFSRSDYMRYHLEVYYGNLLGVFDRCLLLVNELYGLGFKPRDAKYRLIIDNKNLQGKKIVTALQQAHKALENIRPTRNYIEHQGALEDKELDDFRLHELVLRDSPFDKRNTKNLRLDLEYSYREYVNKKKREIAQNNEAMTKIVDRILSALNEKLQEEMKRYKF